MKFVCLFINQKTNERIQKEFTEEEMNKVLGSFIADRAIARGETNTTYIEKGTSYKVLIKYLKN